MKEKEISYNDAIAEIEEILGSLDSERPDVDSLAAKVKRATELIGLCRKKLGRAQEEIDKILPKE